jgi:hypothetical protein
MPGKLILFPEYAPDVTPLGQAESQTIFNVVPRGDGYGPVQSLQGYTLALFDLCRGFFFGRNTDGSITIFAGSATDLYILDNTTLGWRKVSKGGTSYGQLPAGDNWQFAQFNNLVIAVQQNTVPQKFILGSAGNFVDLGGNPPAAGAISIIGFFVVLTALQLNPQRAQWSDLDAPEIWSAGLGLASFQDFPDGGVCLASSGGDAYGLIFQEQSIRTMTYAAGNPAIFQFYRLSTQEALFAKYSITNVGNRVFYLGAAGFKMIVGTADQPVDIGKDKVNISFFNDVDAANLQLIIGASAPKATRVYFAYKSMKGTPNYFDRVLVFDWLLNKWTRLNISGEYLATLAKPGLTLEQMDKFTSVQLLVRNATDNGSGAIRLTLDAVSKPTFDLAAQPFATVQGVVGTTEANGVWRFNIIDGTHADLVGSTFVHPYISGGAIGGSIETIPFSFDTIVKASLANLAAFDSSNVLGFFDGPSLEALLETGDADAEGQMVFTNAVRPITDATQVYCSVGWRLAVQGLLNYTAENLIDDMGMSPIDPIEARYQRGRVRIVAGSSWTFARGIEPESQVAGDR